MICRTCFALVLFLLLLATTGCQKKPSLEERLKTFEGEWNVVQLNREGKVSDDEALKDISVTIRKDHMQFFEGVGKGPVKKLNLEEYRIQIDPSKSSGDVDLVYINGDNVGMTRRGIYEVEDNKLKICLGGIGVPRPTEFVAKQDPGYTLMVLQQKQ